MNILAIDPGNIQSASPDLEIIVYGLPAAQGSKRHVGHGIMVESSKFLKPWREAVKWATLEACKGQVEKICGPIYVEITFTMVRPKSAKKNAVPDKQPDIDKLLRSTFDSLTQVGAWEDDSRVVRCLASKVFPESCQDALRAPGAVIRIYKL